MPKMRKGSHKNTYCMNEMYQIHVSIGWGWTCLQHGNITDKVDGRSWNKDGVGT